MMRRAVCLLLVCLLMVGMAPVHVSAATQSAYAPYAWIEYGYSSTVTCGTVRYVSQVSSDSMFYSAYWPSSTFGNYIGPQVECGTASISMALSYIGINKTADDILTPNNGSTYFSYGWGGSTYYSYSYLSTAMSNYLNGNGKYSPPVIHIPGYSSAGHYVVVVGQISDGVYQILDPWQRALTKMTVSGSSATYTVYGSTIYDTIDQVHQWYNGSASIDYASTCETYASHCTIQASKSTPVNSQPCAAGSNDSSTLETAAAGDTYTAVKLYKNTGGNLWYQVTTTGGKTGYMYAGHVSYVDDIISDITLSGATAPNGQVSGNGFVVNGTIGSKYNYLTAAALKVYSGFGTSGSVAMSASDTVGGTSYTLKSSTIDANTKFGSLATGKYTYVLEASYQNYYASDATTLASNTGTVELMEEYFVVIPSSVSQSSCSHSYSTTTIQAASCTEAGVSVKSCATCGLISETTTAATGHSYGSWSTVEATCIADGSRTRTCSVCGDVQTEVLTSGGHDYTMTAHAATCKDYASYEYVCGDCGDSYTLTADELTTVWVDQIPEGMDESLFESKTQYRYSDYETTTSYETSLDGYTRVGSQWVESGSGTVNYVNSWTTGFSTSSSLYTQYNKKSSKVTASETETAKTVIDSDAVAGYLYHHWCYASSYYSVQSSSGSYTTFHAFYSTTAPSSLSNYDETDGSYYYPNSTTCSNSDWWWPTTVYAQKYTTYKNQFTYERWTDWSDWSDTAATASDTRKVETRTVYQLKEAALGDHSWSEGVCGLCGTACDHSYVDGWCSVCGMEEPVKDYYLFGYINGANYACEEDADNIGVYKFVDGKLVVTFTEVSYVAVKTSNNRYWYMTMGYPGDDATGATLYDTTTLGENADKLRVPKGREITFTLLVNADGTLSLSYVAAECEHSWESGVCSVCDAVCEHYSWTGGVCGVCGSICAHDNWTDGGCDVCDVVCSHSYSNNVCTVCGMAKPVKDYYLFGYIDGADYGCESDYTNLGQYKFVDNKVTAIFKVDSYVGVKSGDNQDWYMTNGWLDYEVTAATLYNTTTGAYEKLHVPSGKIITFTLIDNGNDTYLLTYSAEDCPHDSHDAAGVCALCGQTVEHSYSSGVCTVCGAADPNAVVQPTLKLNYGTVSFESEILYNIYFNASELDDVVEMGMITFDSQLTDGTIADAVKVYSDYSTDGTLYMVATEGISAKYIGDQMWFKIYAKLSDGSYVYTTVNYYSAVRYANSILNRSTSSSYSKALVVAMLNYGAEAQLYF
ncbi:MAG: hypothetical protein IJW45_05040, partial [Oscillospiraceae bacterium]|nr:hypothetical protein [Oscillospiraceae bacterium]